MEAELIQGLGISHEKKARFDGHFFRAILTTGIFCRPICPSRPARAENVLFFSTAAAAAEAGYRPCFRCRPESAPDKPEGVDVSRTIMQALRLISDGVNESKELANQLGLSPRQLRRYFVRDLGAPPVAIIQTKRLLFAKKLIDETHLAMSNVAFAAGYSSIRRFNDAVKQTYGRSPSAIRNSRRNRKVENQPETVSLKLFYRPPYNWPAMWSALSRRLISRIDSIEGWIYKRAVSFDHDSGIISIQPYPEHNYLLLTTPKHLSRHLIIITERVKRLFDLRTSSEMIEAHLQNDPQLAKLIDKHSGLRLMGAWDGFETFVQIILSRSLAADVSTKLIDDLIQTHGKPIGSKENIGLTHTFPRPEKLIDVDLRQLGVPKAQEIAIKNIAQALIRNELNWSLSKNFDHSIKQLCDIAKIAPPMANLIAMHTRSEHNAFPEGNLATPQVFQLAKTDLTEYQRLNQQSEKWAPWRAYASLFLFHDQSGT